MNINANLPIEFQSSALDRIYEKIGQYPAERGGILGADKSGVITHFFFDDTAECATAAYTPNVAKLNAIIAQWKKEGVRFQGFVHSHPTGYRELSCADKIYAKEILGAFKSLKTLLLPLVMTEPDSGDYQLIPFVALRRDDSPEDVVFRPAQISIKGSLTKIPKPPQKAPSKEQNSVAETVSSERQTGVIEPETCWYYGHFKSVAKTLLSKMDLKLISNLTDCEVTNGSDELSAYQQDAKKAVEYFQRVEQAYDVPVLDSTRLVVIGTGGAAQFVRDSARAAFGEVVLCDYDVISASNVATQSVDPTKIGRPKVQALAADIQAINPKSATLAIQAKIEDLSDGDFERLLFSPLRDNKRKLAPSCKRTLRGRAKQRTILVVLTDNFEAQARGHRLGLKFGVPTICAQEYLQGRGAEITWTIPGVTPACHRCITASRYRAYLAEGYKNKVTSEGAPIFAAQLLNAALGHILLAVAHHGTNNSRFGSVIARLGKRNLMLLRMDMDFDAFLGWPAFSRPLTGAADRDSFKMLDAVFLPQGPDRGQTKSRPVCPDCGGSGDLRSCIGKFYDTRIMRTLPHNVPLRRAQATRRSRSKKGRSK